jgi:hypothetical protein
MDTWTACRLPPASWTACLLGGEQSFARGFDSVRLNPLAAGGVSHCAFLAAHMPSRGRPTLWYAAPLHCCGLQGALAGIRALATGVGPLVFSALFSLVTRTDSPWGFHPGAVFWASAALTALAAGVAATIDPRAGSAPPVLASAGDHDHGARGGDTSGKPAGEGGGGATKVHPPAGDLEEALLRGSNLPVQGRAPLPLLGQMDEPAGGEEVTESEHAPLLAATMPRVH